MFITITTFLLVKMVDWETYDFTRANNIALDLQVGSYIDRTNIIFESFKIYLNKELSKYLEEDMDLKIAMIWKDFNSCKTGWNNSKKMKRIITYKTYNEGC